MYGIDMDTKELRRVVRQGYFYGLAAIFIIPLVLFIIPAAIFGAPVTMNGKPSNWLVVLPIMLIMFPIMIFIQGVMFSYLVTFGLWVKSKVNAK